jgi:two-component system response regulator HupR/HoxA
MEHAKPQVLIVDDDKDVVASFINAFSDEFEVIGVTAPEEALACIDNNVVVAVVDERMPRISGVEILKRLRAEKPEVMRILLTGFADFKKWRAAVNEAGIFRYLEKPWQEEEMRRALHQAAEMYRLREENRQLIIRLQGERDLLAAQKQFLISRVARGFAALKGESKKLQEVIDLARRAANAFISVLIEGERGTGKELLAQAIHYEGVRREQFFAAIDCGALSEDLLRSELFGHRRGAFSGAIENRKGILQVADHGTVFLDEIGNTSLSVQGQLLRFLQTGEVRPVGEDKVRHVDVRIIAATNRDLRAEIAAGRFRADLYDRLAKFSLTLPPLREHPEDIPLLAEHFLLRENAKVGKHISSIAADAMLALCRYHFPGNVRELESAIERAVVLADGPELELSHFSERILTTNEISQEFLPKGSKLREYLNECERKYIEGALARNDGNLSRAAEELGITRRWLHERMRALGLRRNR